MQQLKDEIIFTEYDNDNNTGDYPNLNCSDDHLILTDTNTSNSECSASLPQTLTLPIANSYSNHQLTGSMKVNHGSIMNENINIFTKDFFDIRGKYNNLNGNQYMMSSNTFYRGCHEFSIKILKCDLYRQEIGIVSNLDKNICIDMNNGISGTPKLGARAVYGNILQTNESYYASYNKNNTIRCKKDLSCAYNVSWNVGTIVCVKLDLDKGNLKFFINNKKVRKTISCEKNVAYHPIISYFGNCKYEIVDHT